MQAVVVYRWNPHEQKGDEHRDVADAVDEEVAGIPMSITRTPPNADHDGRPLKTIDCNDIALRVFTRHERRMSAKRAGWSTLRVTPNKKAITRYARTARGRSRSTRQAERRRRFVSSAYTAQLSACPRDRDARHEREHEKGVPG